MVPCRQTVDIWPFVLRSGPCPSGLSPKIKPPDERKPHAAPVLPWTDASLRGELSLQADEPQFGDAAGAPSSECALEARVSVSQGRQKRGRKARRCVPEGARRDLL